MRKEHLKMVAGFRRFQEKFFSEQNQLYSKLNQNGQRPKTLMIACSDSRVDPAILFSISPGEIFVVRNVANLVPPYESSEGFHGVSAAIEFAVVNLKVENVMILGHRQCGGIRSLFEPTTETSQTHFVRQWMSIAQPAKNKVLLNYSNEQNFEMTQNIEKILEQVNSNTVNPVIIKTNEVRLNEISSELTIKKMTNLDHLCRECEKESLVVSLENLKTFPFVKEAQAQRGLELYALYFDLEQGQLFHYDETIKEFQELKI